MNKLTRLRVKKAEMDVEKAASDEEEDDVLSEDDEDDDDDDSISDDDADSAGEGDDDDDTKGQEEDDEDEERDKGPEVSGWADSISKILKSTKPKAKKDLILSRARKDYEVIAKAAKAEPVKGRRKPMNVDDIEVVPSKKPKSSTEKEEEETPKRKNGPAAEAVLSLKKQRKLELKQKKLELAWENLARMSAEKGDPQLERDLVKVATRGVVQLFNAISSQQKSIKTKLRTDGGKSEFRRDKVIGQSKDLFESALGKEKKSNSSKNAPNEDSGSEFEETEIKEEDETSSSEDDVPSRKKKPPTKAKGGKPAWNALQDDFMLGAKLKDWDDKDAEEADEESD